MPYISSDISSYISSYKRGWEEGRREAFCWALEGRFGLLPTEIEDRVAKSTNAELKAWLKAAFNAPTLESVFTSR
jgi:hypothetical protein